MPTDIKEIAKLKACNRCLLSLDLGAKRIGVGISDRNVDDCQLFGSHST